MSYQIRMTREQLPRTGVALGGIGTGWFEIRQDGGFHHWQIYNNWPLFPGKRYPYNEKQSLFFMLWVRPENEAARLVLLQIEDGHDAAAIERHEFQYMFPWISGVDTIHFQASVPFADLAFEQDGLPLRINLRAWSPLIPGNTRDSGLPTAFFDFTITSTGDRPVDVQILASARNAVGYDQPDRVYQHDRVMEDDFSAVVMTNGQMDPEAATTGTVTLASFAKSSRAYSGWEHHHPYYERLLREYPLPEYDDTEGRNHTDEESGQKRADPRCFITMGRPHHLKARGDSFDHTFSLSWHFPNLYGRPLGQKGDDPTGEDRFEGHAYADHFPSSLEVARYGFAEKERLLRETTAFHRAFFDSDLEPEILDQVNSHLNTLRTSTWHTKTGLYGVLEGLSHTKPYAGIATTDVAMYGQIATSLLFPELDQKTVRSWCRFQAPNGIVPHSIPCNSHVAGETETDGKRLDLPAQFAYQALRCALWSGDEAFLDEIWEPVKRALAYVLRERDANGDHLPDMEGVMCSYDNFPMYGVAPFVVTQWLAAVALALKVARRKGDEAFLAEYEPKYEEGRQTFAQTTWNGRYFSISSIEDPNGTFRKDGCLTDQLIGNGLRHPLDLPPFLPQEKVEVALDSCLRMNYQPSQGLRNCQWPGEGFLHDVGPDDWVDQANTAWTGVELLFAAQLLYEGRRAEAREVIRNVDARYRKWGIYFDHQEFGGHYFRAMSALAIPNAAIGLRYDGETLKIQPPERNAVDEESPPLLPKGRWCFLLPGAYGTFFRNPDHSVVLRLLSGNPPLRTILVGGASDARLEGFPGQWTQHTEADGQRFSRCEDPTSSA